MRKTGIVADQWREGGREILRGSEKGEESIIPTMTAKMRESVDTCRPHDRLYGSSTGSSPGSLRRQTQCTSQSQKSEVDNQRLKFNSNVFQGCINTSTRDSPKSHKHDSRRRNSKDKNLANTPRENNTTMKSLTITDCSRTYQSSRVLPSTSRRSPLCLRPNTEARR